MNSRFQALASDAKSRIKEVTPQLSLDKLQQGNTHIIDVRETHEWQAGHLPAAKHLSKGVIESKIEQVIPDTGAEIILYCGGGSRSALAADNLQKMGYHNIYSLQGGFRGWQELGYPIEN
jgi:rhodanese-related sulfurtransferase